MEKKLAKTTTGLSKGQVVCVREGNQKKYVTITFIYDLWTFGTTDGSYWANDIVEE